MLGFLGAWFFLILAPTSSFVPVRDAAFDHRMYLPLAAIVIGVILAVDHLWRQLLAESWRTHAKSPLFRTAPLILATICTLALGLVTAERNKDYETPATIWRDVVAKRPNNARAKNNLANFVGLGGDVAQAKELIEEALRIDPEYADAHASLGNLFRRQERYEESISEYRQAVRIQPHHALAQAGWAESLLNLDQPREALPHYIAAAEASPDDAGARYLLAGCLRKLGDSIDAIEQYQEAIRLEPTFVTAHNNLASLLAKVGRTDEAIQHFQRALQLQPSHASAHTNLGMAYLKKRMLKEAIAEWREGVRWDPYQEKILANLALVLATNADADIRNGGDAVEFARRAVKLADRPDANILAILAAAQAETGDFNSALESANQALALAESRDNKKLVDDLHEKLKLYRSGRPYHEQQ